jgi:hypothetical protein
VKGSIQSKNNEEGGKGWSHVLREDYCNKEVPLEESASVCSWPSDCKEAISSVSVGFRRNICNHIEVVA